jgi:hypothetical protein
MHALDPRHLSTLAPAFAPGGAGRPGGGDGVQIGFVDGAPGLDQIGQQAGQIAEIAAAALAHATCGAARQSIKADGLELLAADAAISRFHAHPLHIFATSRPYKIGRPATAAGTFTHCRSAFRAETPLLDALRRPCQSLELLKTQGLRRRWGIRQMKREAPPCSDASLSAFWRRPPWPAPPGHASTRLDRRAVP